jgi:hypothetical protein
MFCRIIRFFLYPISGRNQIALPDIRLAGYPVKLSGVPYRKYKIADQWCTQCCQLLAKVFCEINWKIRPLTKKFVFVWIAAKLFMILSDKHTSILAPVLLFIRNSAWNSATGFLASGIFWGHWMHCISQPDTFSDLRDMWPYAGTELGFMDTGILIMGSQWQCYLEFLVLDPVLFYNLAVGWIFSGSPIFN